MITRNAKKTSQRILSAASKGIRGVLRKIRYARRPEPKILLNFKEFRADDCSKRALLSYLVSPLLPPANIRDRTIFSNLGIAQQIPQILNELGYIVDIIQYDLPGWNVSGSYDLFIGHGGINFEEISRQLPDCTTRIYFSTGIYWKELNIREAKRLYDLALRCGNLLNPDRTIKQSEEFANRTAHGIICLGNQAAVDTYKDFPLVIGINNATYPLTWSGWKNKDYKTGRRHFLFFSGGGNVHKGLDLLLEAFAGTELHLHICQDIDHQFHEVYGKELSGCPNIHVYNRIPMRSAKFESLALLCNWAITATCAEGQPGAIIECMAYGLIPVLPASANISLEGFGLSLNECIPEAIRESALQAATMDVAECKRRSLMTMTAVRKEYSPDSFRRNFDSALRRILDLAVTDRTGLVSQHNSNDKI